MNESSPEVGSSQKSKEGFVSSSEARARRFRSPPDIHFEIPGIPIWESWHFVRDNWKKNRIQML